MQATLPYSGHWLSVYPSAANLTASQAGTVRGTGPNFYLNKKSAWRLRPALFSPPAWSIQPGWVIVRAKGKLSCPFAWHRELLAATTLQEGGTGPVGEGDSDPGQADVPPLLPLPLPVPVGGSDCARTRLILVCPPQG